MQMKVQEGAAKFKRKEKSKMNYQKNLDLDLFHLLNFQIVGTHKTFPLRMVKFFSQFEVKQNLFSQ